MICDRGCCDISRLALSLFFKPSSCASGKRAIGQRVASRPTLATRYAVANEKGDRRITPLPSTDPSHPAKYVASRNVGQSCCVFLRLWNFSDFRGQRERGRKRGQSRLFASWAGKGDRYSSIISDV